jgi:PAS domain S-box-containing protein
VLSFLARSLRLRPAAQRPGPSLHAATDGFCRLLERGGAVVWIMSADAGAVRYVSTTCERLWECPREKLYREPGSWMAAVHAEDRDRVAGVLGGPLREPVEVQYRIVCPGGAVHWLRDRVVLIAADGGGDSYLIRVTEDITDAIHLEEQLRQGQKLELIGRMAGGLAHDLNNILTIILTCAKLLEQGQAAGCAPADLLEQITQSTGRAATLTRQLLAFSRKQVLMPRVLSLNAVVKDCTGMIERLVGEGVQLVLDLHAVASVKADPSQIDQVLLNLAANARDAMPSGGRLTIRAADASGDELPAGVPPGRYTVLSVTDTGHGMDEATMAHIFEPFFTTKGPDKGTGLGLAIVRDIVTQLGGHISLSSAPGRGTTFHVCFEAPEGVPEAAATVRRPADTPVRGQGTVLVVEDDDELRPLIRNMLSRAGYSVLEARQGAEALTLAEHHAGPIDLLLTDVVMPGLTGPELARRLRRLWPDVKVLYTSGYPSAAVLRYGVPDLNTAFLQKPFAPSLLQDKVRAVLGQPHQAPAPPQPSLKDQPLRMKGTRGWANTLQAPAPRTCPSPGSTGGVSRHNGCSRRARGSPPWRAPTARPARRSSSRSPPLPGSVPPPACASSTRRRCCAPSAARSWPR